jgi:Patatin-like phospholipase.
LALSGGGIRSATFCLGLVRALAKKGLLKKFDYISTVSGGGYLGGMLGRLYEANPADNSVEEALASDDTILLAWLRNNGRYLTPAGFRDTSLAISQILRSFFAALFLITLIGIFIAGLAISLNFLANVSTPTELLDPIENATLFWALSVPFTFSVWMATTYWLTLLKCSLKIHLVGGLILTLLAGGAVFFIICANHVTTQPGYINFILCGVHIRTHSDFPLRMMVINFALNAFLLCRLLSTLASTTAKFRQQLTLALTWCLGYAALLVLLWLIYKFGYALNESIESSFEKTLLPPGIIALLKVIWEIKAVKGLVTKLLKKSNTVKLSLTQLANIFGFIIIITSLISICVAEIHFLKCHLTVLGEWLGWFPALLSVMIAVVAIPALRSEFMLKFLNLSSLHNFYRARLERAWLSVANFKGEHPRFKQNPLDVKYNDKLNYIHEVTDSLPGDDIKFKDYYAGDQKGPIHLITCCINQTIDDRSGNYNADRKGVALTLSGFGVETGTRLPKEPKHALGSMLSQWIAVSGAAAATGMGSQTAPGLAFLLFLIGGRLGYWSKNLLDSNHKASPVSVLFAEMFARFPGKNSKYWYLSDGGHFENTGVYPLLKRRVKTIVVADCGADPEFIFDDLENLVRKARIDYGISIVFNTSPGPEFSSVSSLKKGEIAPPLIKATINYPAQNSKPAMKGTLIVIKPHLLENMGLDTERYAKRHDDFPQQTTGDQFFDEEQWEAYHQLGLQAGKAITRDMLS